VIHGSTINDLAAIALAVGLTAVASSAVAIIVASIVLVQKIRRRKD